MKKYVIYILIIIILTGGFTTMAIADGENGGKCEDLEAQTKADCEAIGKKWTSNQGYQLLAPLPCPGGGTACYYDKMETFDTTQGLGAYLNPMIKIFIGLCAVLSVVMIVIGGMEYMTSELISSKQAGKERITHAILGLIIALGAYALLNTINPKLLETDVKSLNSPDTTTKPG